LGLSPSGKVPSFPSFPEDPWPKHLICWVEVKKQLWRFKLRSELHSNLHKVEKERSRKKRWYKFENGLALRWLWKNFFVFKKDGKKEMPNELLNFTPLISHRTADNKIIQFIDIYLENIIRFHNVKSRFKVRFKAPKLGDTKITKRHGLIDTSEE